MKPVLMRLTRLINQLLTRTAGQSQDTVTTLDALHRQRNAVDYSGDLVTDSAVHECIAEAQKLLAAVSESIASEHPELLADS